MRIPCPFCGPRDRREFTYLGADNWAEAPGPEAGLDALDDWLHLRDNPAGEGQELWQHDGGCRAWLIVTRNMTTHEIVAVRPAPGTGGKAA